MFRQTDSGCLHHRGPCRCSYYGGYQSNFTAEQKGKLTCRVLSFFALESILVDITFILVNKIHIVRASKLKKNSGQDYQYNSVISTKNTKFYVRVVIKMREKYTVLLLYSISSYAIMNVSI